MASRRSEQHSITIDGERVNYVLQRSRRRRKTIQLQVDPDIGVKVLVPHAMLIRDVEDFILRRSDWLLKHLEKVSASQSGADWSKGGELSFRGRQLQVQVEVRKPTESSPIITPTIAKSLEGCTIFVTIPAGVGVDNLSHTVKEVLVDWYRREAIDHLTSRTQRFASVMGVQPSAVKVSNARKRWGSCSNKGSINYNWRLTMLDDELIDYVVVHELSHIKVMDHSSAFWQEVASIIPEWKRLRQKLMDHSPSRFG